MIEADILIRGCTILPMKDRQVIGRGLIAIKGKRIIYVGEDGKVHVKAEKVIEGKHTIAMPGLVNCHTHVAMTLFRGIAEDRRLNDWLKNVIWPLEAKLKPQDVYYGALLGCLEMIKSGTTCFADMYFYEDMVAKAVGEAGLRAVLASGVIEAGDKRRGEKMLRDGVEFAEKYHKTFGGRVYARLAPHATYTCSPNLLAKIGEEASKLGVGVHIHLAESKEMAKLVRKKYGCSEVELLEKLGLLNLDVLAAHCIHLSRRDMKLMAKRGVKVAYIPVANMKIASGVARVKELMEIGMTVGIGTDGPASNNSLDMFENMKFASLLQKVYYLDPRLLPAYEVVEMATLGGARALGLDKEIGSLEVGKKADIILVDVKRPHLTPMHDPYASLAYSACGSDVKTVIVDGNILMEDWKVKVLDEEEVIEKVEETALNLLHR